MAEDGLSVGDSTLSTESTYGVGGGGGTKTNGRLRREEKEGFEPLFPRFIRWRERARTK